ncbi:MULTISPECIES: hypothetical protein [Methanobacterium]|uniref:Uncharacterized protein n=1 Tax=Methanobacterium bryantii TaxID=2161 RepID=A0A2A2H962_METBR|nr:MULTISPECIES: hypothetical protein [Methanobacterium]OEC85671.1 hypothetical protein A9507_13005 [Methanobacterium sp. A39]PAV05895.1 hypothetical protein ASJ80_13615 [Methanobacterium bryantii]
MATVDVYFKNKQNKKHFADVTDVIYEKTYVLIEFNQGHVMIPYSSLEYVNVQDVWPEEEE